MVRKDMARFQRLTSLVVLLALSGALAGCGGGGMSGWDPTDMLDFLDTKKKLPGDRKPVFPEGVPGLTPGVPKEYYRGAQAEPEAPPVVAPEEPKGRRSAKSAKASAKTTARSQPAVQVAPADTNVSDEGEPAAVPDAPREAKPKIARRRTTAPPPDQPPAAVTPSQPAQAASPFPAPMPSGTFSR